MVHLRLFYRIEFGEGKCPGLEDLIPGPAMILMIQGSVRVLSGIHGWKWRRFAQRA
jgi:hypothetical protein